MLSRSAILSLLLPAILGLGGCSTISNLATSLGSKKNSAGRSDQMRIASDGVILQPLVRLDVPQFNGLQTPLAGSSRSRTTATPRAIGLPNFTPVKVLSNNGQTALIEIKGGQRGYVPSQAVASETDILAAAKPATPAQPVYSNMPIDPATGLPYDSQALYLPSMDAGDAPVDQAMLNNIDSIPLPESESHPLEKPEAAEVDGVVLRNPTSPAAPQ